METAERATLAMNRSQPIPPYCTMLPSSGANPKGLALGNPSMGPGVKAMPNPIVPMAATESHPTGRQRPEGSRPSGNISSRKVRAGPAPTIQIQETNHAAQTVPGSVCDRDGQPRDCEDPADPIAGSARHEKRTYRGEHYDLDYSEGSIDSTQDDPVRRRDGPVQRRAQHYQHHGQNPQRQSQPGGGATAHPTYASSPWSLDTSLTTPL